jgi:hypothetical protein
MLGNHGKLRYFKEIDGTTISMLSSLDKSARELLTL